MQQFYFLSIVANALAGMTLCAEFLRSKFPGFATIEERLSGGGVRASIGGVAAVVGFFKLFIRSTPTDLRVVGDLFPALVGIAMGGALILEFMDKRNESGEPNEAVGRAASTLTRYRVPLGMAGILIGVLHFFIPGAVIF